MFRRGFITVVFGISCAAAAAGCGSDDSEPSNTGGSSATGGSGGSTGGSSGSGGGATGGASGSGGDATGGTGGGLVDGPADGSQQSIAAYLTAEQYKTGPWTPETAGPRDASDATSPHGRVRVYLNDTVVQSIAAGNGELTERIPHTTGSMAVKEFYDDADTLVGIAAMYKQDGGFTDWAYYCWGPQGRCGTETGTVEEDEPVYGIASAVGCGFCHGGVVFTPPPN